MSISDNIYYLMCEIFLILFKNLHFTDIGDLSTKLSVVFVGASMLAFIIFCNIFFILLESSKKSRIFLFCNLLFISSILYSMMAYQKLSELTRYLAPPSLVDTKIDIGEYMYFVLINTFVLMIISQLPIFISFISVSNNKYLKFIYNHHYYLLISIAICIFSFSHYDLMLGLITLIPLFIYMKIGIFISKMNYIFDINFKK